MLKFSALWLQKNGTKIFNSAPTWIFWTDLQNANWRELNWRIQQQSVEDEWEGRFLQNSCNTSKREREDIFIAGCTELAKKDCPRWRDSACWRCGEITQPRTYFFDHLCTWDRSVTCWKWSNCLKFCAGMMRNMIQREICERPIIEQWKIAPENLEVARFRFLKNCDSD